MQRLLLGNINNLSTPPNYTKLGSVVVSTLDRLRAKWRGPQTPPSPSTGVGGVAWDLSLFFKHFSVPPSLSLRLRLRSPHNSFAFAVTLRMPRPKPSKRSQNRASVPKLRSPSKITSWKQAREGYESGAGLSGSEADETDIVGQFADVGTAAASGANVSESIKLSSTPVGLGSAINNSAENEPEGGEFLQRILTSVQSCDVQATDILCIQNSLTLVFSRDDKKGF